MRKKIKQILKKFKQFFQHRETFFVLIIFFTATTSFLLGKISEQYKNHQTTNSDIKLIQENKLENIKLVASKKGKKYHLPWCSGALSMSEKNKIFFANQEEAKKAGYTPAKNCEGL